MDAGCWKQRGEENDSRLVGELAYLLMESSPLVVAIVSIGLFIIERSVSVMRKKCSSF